MRSPPEFLVHVTERGVPPKRNATPCVLGDHLLSDTARLNGSAGNASRNETSISCASSAPPPSRTGFRAEFRPLDGHDACGCRFRPRTLVWSAPEVRDALTDAVQYLTGDSWNFEFVFRHTRDEAALQLFLRQERPSHPVVLPYSGGLDSLAEFLRLRAEEPHVTPLLLTTEHGANRQTVAATLKQFLPHAQLGFPFASALGSTPRTLTGLEPSCSSRLLHCSQTGGRDAGFDRRSGPGVRWAIAGALRRGTPLPCNASRVHETPGPRSDRTVV